MQQRQGKRKLTAKRWLMLLAASMSFVAFDSEVVGAGWSWGVECEEKTCSKRRGRNTSDFQR